MKIVAARLNHETNTFSPVPTPLASFGPDGPTFGAAAYAQARGTRTGLGAFIDAAEAARRHDRGRRQRDREPERAGRGRRVRAAVRRDRRGRARRLRRDPARPARRDGQRAVRRRRRRTAATHPRDRARTRRSRSRSTCTATSRRRWSTPRRRHGRVQDLSAHRHVRDRRARGAAAVRHGRQRLPPPHWRGRSRRCCRTRCAARPARARCSARCSGRARSKPRACPPRRCSPASRSPTSPTPA